MTHAMKSSALATMLIIGSIRLLAQPVSPQRLVAQAHYSLSHNSGALSRGDSAYYEYFDSASSSRFNFSKLCYDDLSSIRSGASQSLTRPIPTNNVDSQDYLLIRFDTATYFSRNGLAGGERRQYLPNGLISIVNDVTRQQTINVFNGGLLSTKIYLTSSSDTVAFRHFQYDGMGRMILDSMSGRNGGGFSPGNRFTYTYSGNSKGCQTVLFEANYLGSFTKQYRATNTYRADGRVQTTTMEAEISGGLVLYWVDSFGYTAGQWDYSFWLREYPNGNAEKTEVNRVNKFGRPDSVTSYFLRNGIWEPSEGWAARYDKGGYPIARYTYMADTTVTGLTAAPTSIDYYYYNKTVGLGITSRPKIASYISVYPNPTSGLTYLRLSDAPRATPLSVLITNANGQLIYTETAVWDKEEHCVLLGSKVPSGVYLVQIVDKQGVVLGIQPITKE